MIEQSEIINDLAFALCEFQSQISDPNKNAEGYNYNYASFHSIMEMARPLMKANGLAVTQLIGADDCQNPTLTTMLIHTSGQYIRTSAIIPTAMLEGNDGKNHAKVMGASITYMRRYAFISILGIAQADNNEPQGAGKNKIKKKDAKPWYNDFEQHSPRMAHDIQTGAKTGQQIIDAIMETYNVNKKTRDAILEMEQQIKTQPAAAPEQPTPEHH